MNNLNYQLLGKCFTRNTFMKIINDHDYELYRTCGRIFLDEESLRNTTNKDVIVKLYSVLKKNYRNEYFFKNTLFNKLVIGRHSVNTTVALAEIPIAYSKADFILVNDDAKVYEVKSEIDSLDRLMLQTYDYYKVFNTVSVITSEKSASKIMNSLQTDKIGVYVLNTRDQISTRREPTVNNEFLNFEDMFSVLRKKEHENIIKDYYGHLPTVPRTQQYQKYQELTSQIDVIEFNKLMIKQLRTRNINHKNEFTTLDIPEINYIAYFANLTKNEYRRLKLFLESQYGG